MSVRYLSLLGLLLGLFSLPANAERLRWPTRGPDPYPWAQGKNGDTIVADRFSAASVASLGVAADIASIKAVVVVHMKTSQAKVYEIRWITPTLAMVSCGWYSGPLAAAHYYYIVEKANEGWFVKTYYLTSIS